MRISAALVGVAASFVVASAVLAAGKRDLEDCRAHDPGRSIIGCTRVIQSQRETANDRAIAYYNRRIFAADRYQSGRG